MTPTPIITLDEFEAAVKHVGKICTKEFLIRMYVQINESVIGIRIDEPTTLQLLNDARALFEVKKTIPKEMAAIVFVKAFIDPQLLRLFVAQLPTNVRRVLDMIAWQGPQSVMSLEKEVGPIRLVEITNVPIHNRVNYDLYANRPYMLLQPELHIFEIHKPTSHYYSYNISVEHVLKLELQLSPVLLRLYRAIFPMPKEYELHLLDEPPEAEQYYVSDDDIVESAVDVYEYIVEGYVDFTNAGKPKKASSRKMRDAFRLSEFYPATEKNLDLLRTDKLIALFSELPSSTKSNGIAIIRKIIDYLVGKGKNNHNLFEYYFGHIYNQIGIVFQSNHTPESLASLLSAFQSLAPGKWVEVENFINYITAIDMMKPFLDRELMRYHCRVTVTEQTANRYPSQDTFTISGSKLKDFMFRPMVYTFGVTLAALGLADICYDTPEGWRSSGSTMATEPTFAAALRGIRLNDLGAYILGITDNYSPKQVKKNKVTVELDPERLIAVMSGDDFLVSAFLSRYGEKISDRHYRMSHTSVISDCSSSTEIARKVEQFTEKFGKNIPQNWQDFLSSFADRTDVLVPVEGYIVFSIMGDATLLGLLARDAVLQKYILKVEGRRVAIEHQHWTKVRNRLKELGYFMRSGS